VYLVTDFKVIPATRLRCLVCCFSLCVFFLYFVGNHCLIYHPVHAVSGTHAASSPDLHALIEWQREAWSRDRWRHIGFLAEVDWERGWNSRYQATWPRHSVTKILPLAACGSVYRSWHFIVYWYDSQWTRPFLLRQFASIISLCRQSSVTFTDAGSCSLLHS